MPSRTLSVEREIERTRLELQALEPKKAELAREMASLIIHHRGGIADDIEEFYLALHGAPTSPHAESWVEHSELAAKIVGEAHPGRLFLHEREKSTLVGVISPESLHPNEASDTPYRFRIRNYGQGEVGGRWFGDISVPVLFDPRENRSHWDQLAYTEVQVIEGRLAAAREIMASPNSLHIGAEAVLRKAAELGGAALNSTITLIQQTEGKGF